MEEMLGLESQYPLCVTHIQSCQQCKIEHSVGPLMQKNYIGGVAAKVVFSFPIAIMGMTIQEQNCRHPQLCKSRDGVVNPPFFQLYW